MSGTLHLGEIISINAGLFPGKQAARDLTRSLTFRGWNDRACKLANAFLGLGLEKGDRIAVLAYNCLEWMEIYAAVAKAGLVMVPINFRLVGSEVRYIVENSEAKAIIVQDDLLDSLEEIRAERLIAEDKYVHFGGRTRPPGYRSYEDLDRCGLAVRAVGQTPARRSLCPSLHVRNDRQAQGRDPQMAAVWSFRRISCRRTGALVETISAFWSCRCATRTRIYFCPRLRRLRRGCCVYDRKSFEPEQLLTTLADDKFTFTSLVPTHYIMMLGLPESGEAQAQRGERRKASDLVGAGSKGHQAGADGLFPESRSSTRPMARPRRAG